MQNKITDQFKFKQDFLLLSLSYSDFRRLSAREAREANERTLKSLPNSTQVHARRRKFKLVNTLSLGTDYVGWPDGVTSLLASARMLLSCACCDSVILRWVAGTVKKKTCVDLRANLNLSKVSQVIASERKMSTCVSICPSRLNTKYRYTTGAHRSHTETIRMKLRVNISFGYNRF